MTVEPEIVEKPPLGRPPSRARNRAPTFQHRDLKYAIKAAKDAGLENYRMKLTRLAPSAWFHYRRSVRRHHRTGQTNGTKC